MTFLEIVFATAMMSIVAGGVFSAFAFVLGSQQRMRERQMATEVANRLVIAYLDAPTQMPDPSRLLEYGPQDRPLKWRWQYREEPVLLVEARPEARDSSRQMGVSNDRFRRVVVRVWLSEESGGSATFDSSIPSAELARMVDPLAMRNPDAVRRLMSDEAAMRQLMGNLMGGTAMVGGGTSFTGGQASARRTRGESRSAASLGGGGPIRWPGGAGPGGGGPRGGGGAGLRGSGGGGGGR